MKSLFSIVLVGLFATGCSTYSKQECIDMDQSQIGYKVGIDGKNSFDSAINDLKSNCESEHGVQINTQKVKQGWEDGLRFYCSSNGGMRAGSSGLTYSGACSKEDEKKFFDTYNPSRMSYLENKVKELEKNIEVLKSYSADATTRANTCESNVSSLQSQLSSAESRAASCN